MESRTRNHPLLFGLAVGTLGCLVLFFSLIGHNLSHTLWADNYDARLLHWIAAWGYKIIFELRDPANFWNAPSFYPHQNSLAFSDSLLSAQLFYAPLRALGLSSFAALYATLICVCLMGCVLSALALKRIGSFSELESAIIVYVPHFGLSISGYLPHYQLFGFQLAFPFFLFLYLFLRDFEFRDLATLSFCFVFGVCFSTYLAPMLVCLGLIVALPALFHRVNKDGLAGLARKLGAKSLVLIIAVAALLYTFQFKTYLKADKTLASQALSETVLYSATPATLLAPVRGGVSLFYAPVPEEARFGDAERSFFPGFIIATASLMLLVLAALKPFSARRDFPNFEGCDLQLLKFMTLLTASALLLTFGPYFLRLPSIKLPFYYLSMVIPGLDRVRAPGRFGIFLGLPMAYFCVCLLRQLISPLYLQRALACLCLLVFTETLPRYRTFKFEPDPRGIYLQLQGQIPIGEALLELPIAGADPLRMTQRITDQLWGTLIHGGRTILGYGSKNTTEAEEFGLLDLKVQRAKVAPEEIIKLCQQFKISILAVHIDRYEQKVQRRWIKLFKNSAQFQKIIQQRGSVVVRINP